MATAGTAKPPPVSATRMRQIAQDACDSALQQADSYVHAQTASWNNTVINKILESLVASGSTSSAPAGNPQYKFAVNSTIIQHLTERELKMSDSATSTADASRSGVSATASSENTEIKSEPDVAGGVNGGSVAAPGSESVKPEKGRRGMHSATGAYWNNDTDGMWSFKWEGAEKKGMDVVVSIIWIAV